jgi:hypothetical protein
MPTLKVNSWLGCWNFTVATGSSSPSSLWPMTLFRALFIHSAWALITHSGNIDAFFARRESHCRDPYPPHAKPRPWGSETQLRAPADRTREQSRLKPFCPWSAPHLLLQASGSSAAVQEPRCVKFCGKLAAATRVFFTGGNRAVYRDYRCYRWGTVTVPSGSNQSQNSNLNLNLKNEKINKNHQKIVHDL